MNRGIGEASVGFTDPSWGAFSGAIWFGVVVLAFGLGIAVLAHLRRRFRPHSGSVGAPFSLDELRRLRASGELTEAEFLRLRSRMLQSIRESGDA